MRTLFSPIQEFLKKGDLVLLSLCLLTSGFGVALIFSATRYNQNNRPVAIQCIAIFLGVAVYLLCTFVDFQLLWKKTGSGSLGAAYSSCSCCSPPWATTTTRGT